MQYIKQNLKEFALSGILRWHEAGYTGKGIRIANMEGTDPSLWFFEGKVKDPFGNIAGVGRNYHGHYTADVLHQVAPDADIYILSNSGRYSSKTAEGDFVDVSIPFMESEGIHLVNASLGGTDNRILNERIKQAQSHGVTFVTSAGNKAEKGAGGYARSGVWIAVGAVHLSVSEKGEILHAEYSSIDEEVDFVQFSDLYVHDARKGYEDRTFPVQGTSFSSPMLCGMLALVQQFFLERAGRTLYQDELYEFIKDYSVDLWEPGHDAKSGYGLFILPDPENIDVWKYVGKEDKPEVNNPEYIIIHHSATTQGDAETFRRAHIARGWRDIGYHYVIGNGTYSGDGEVETGRPENEVGAHCTGMNDRSIGICLVGDFENQTPTPAQMQALENLVLNIAQRYKIPVENILGHREVTGANTACPGRNFDMKEFRMQILKRERMNMEKKDYAGHWAEAAIEKVKAAGLMSGYPDGSFKPDQPVTRAELAVVLTKLVGKTVK